MKKRLISNVERFMEDWSDRDDAINVSDKPRYGIYFYWNGKLYVKYDEFDHELVRIPDNNKVIKNGNYVEFVGLYSHESEYNNIVPNPKPEDYEVVPRGRVLLVANQNGGNVIGKILIPKDTEDNDYMISEIIREFNLSALKKITIEDDEVRSYDGDPVAHYDVFRTAQIQGIWNSIEYLTSVLIEASNHEFIKDDGISEIEFKEIIVNPNPGNELIDILISDYRPFIKGIDIVFNRNIVVSAYNATIKLIKEIYNV